MSPWAFSFVPAMPTMMSTMPTALLRTRVKRYGLHRRFWLTWVHRESVLLRLSRSIHAYPCDARFKCGPSVMVAVVMASAVVSSGAKAEGGACEQCKHECFFLSAFHRYGPRIGRPIRRFASEAN